MPLFDPQQLRRLDWCSPEFPNYLASTFHEQGYRDYVAGLQDEGSALLIEYLDNALDALNPTNPVFWRCLLELREICGHHKTMPQSCVLLGSPPITEKWPIASRGYYDVYEGSHDDSKVSVKKVRILPNNRVEEAKRAFFQEVALWRRMVHPNIVPFIGATADPFQALSAWMTGGELSDYITAHPCANRFGLISDVAHGLGYLHSHSVVHGDLKGPSILVDDTGRARLTDFGLAAIVLDVESAGSIKDGHAVRWAAPEIIDMEQPVNKKSDVYSFAMVMIEALTGQAPFYGIAPVTVAVRILAGKRPPRPTHSCLSNDLWQMMERCWNRDPRHRPDISEVLLCLHTTPALRSDRSNANHCQAPEDTTTLESIRERDFSIRLCFQPSRWAPISHVLRRFRKLGPMPWSTSDAEQGEGACSERYEKAANKRQPGCTSNIPRRGGLWFSKYGALRHPRTAYQRNKTKPVPVQDCAPPVPGQADNRSVSLKRSLVRWAKDHASLRAYSRSV